MATLTTARQPPSMAGYFGNFADRRSEIPDIIEFVTSDKYLNRPLLYPRQATLLKTMFLQDELFTQYDYDVLEEWANGFHFPDPERLEQLGPDDAMRYEGNNGIQPDVLDRIRMLQDRDAHWFRENVVVMGRRASKGYLGALAGAYVLYYYILSSNPQRAYGIDRDKALACFVFAAKKEQAKANQWKDLVHVITGSNIFHDYNGLSLIPDGMPMAETLRLWAPNDYMRTQELRDKGNRTQADPTFEILPKESTVASGRGPAAFMHFYDEMAWVVKGVANVTAEEMYGSAKPSLDQFGPDAFMYEGSSPWQMMGQFYANWENALEVDKSTHRPVYPEMLMVQLASWDPYEDWERAHLMERVPVSESSASYHFLDGESKTVPLRFDRIVNPVQTYNEDMEREERANPETFAVERKSHWAAAQDAYLNPLKVDAMFGRMWQGKKLTIVKAGILERIYVAHGDPSKSGANFGWAIGHTEGPDKDGLLHVVFDVVHAWRPSDYEPGEDGIRQIDYIALGEEIKEYIRLFIPETVTFDQWNSVSTIQALQSYVRHTQLPRRVTVYERTATYEQNWRVAETFKSALNMGLVHAPEHELAKLELKFLQENNRRVDHPTSGPVQTKDVADCLMIVTYALIGDQMAAYLKKDLGSLHPGAAMQGGMRETERRAQEADPGAGLSNFKPGVRSLTPSRGRGVPQGMSMPQRSGRMGRGGAPRIRRR